MKKEERIKKDKNVLIKNDYKNPRLHQAFDYYQDWSNAVMMYVCEFGKDIYIKYSMPKNFNIYDIFEDYVKPKLSAPIESADMEYKEKGAVFNVVLKNKKVAYAKMKPNMQLEYKEVDFYGKTQRMDS